MNAEKKEQIRSKSQGKQISETVKTVNIINLVIIVGGFFLMILNYSELMTRIGQGLIMAGAFLILLTIIFQVMMASKMRRGKL
ncbi:hypothetical protein MmiHf6_14140 [Methanimicrococcus hongohii]|uniref:Uncharacterized protein n=1 Tax=Methanimicrococcus hongohii TaxID=3028295 RepID=A0AA96V1D9_9EURY|nr:hypothetical protein [Methanimicrococcus sp. Hf6]WNY24085.1 hypothetical protein MmiHf6_14140 [Methanimicrococcus sp. Hf6]